MEPPRPFDTAATRTARGVESVAELASEQHELLRELRDQLADSEERRAKAEQAAADAEARRHAAIMWATWGAAVVGAVVACS